MRPVRLSDFSGGLSEVLAAEDFAVDSLARARGVVLDSPVTLRSQWELQRLNLDSFAAVRGFASTSNYLVGIKASGQVWWAPVPAVDATDFTITWTRFNTVAYQPAYRFIGEIPYEASMQTITNIDPDSNNASVSFDVTLYGKNALLLNANASGLAPVVIYESAPNTLSAFTYDKFYPSMVDHPTITNFKIPDTEVMPRANVGVIWGDRLVLADIEWYESTGTNQTLSAATVTRYKNAMWFSEPGAVDTFDPLSVVVPCSSEAQIVGLEVLDVGLLVLTTSASGRDGLILLRGTPGNFRVEVLRSGLTAAPRSTSVHRPLSTNWTETGTVVFIDDRGAVWQTNGSDVSRLDGQTLAQPSEAATDKDHCASLGPWLFVSRGKRLLVMRAFRGDGAWTELLYPGCLTEPATLADDFVTAATVASQVESMTVIGGALYFLDQGLIHRFTVSNPGGARGCYSHKALHGASFTAHTHRISGITVATPTVAVEQNGDGAHQRALWHRIGVRLAGSGTTGPGPDFKPTPSAGSYRPSMLNSITVHVGPALAPVASHTVNAAAATDGRFELVVPAGIGYAVEASATISLTGDNAVESITFWASGGEPRR